MLRKGVVLGGWGRLGSIERGSWVVGGVGGRFAGRGGGETKV